MKTTRELVTPEKAKEWLSGKVLKRLFKVANRNNYARMMRAGLWMEDTGESIKFAYDGTLIDGWHRLQAVVSANVAITFRIDRDMDIEVFKYLDSGSRRSVADVFTIEGINYASSIGMVIQKYIMLKSGKIGLDGTHGAGRTLSSSELLTIYEKNSKFWDAVMSMSAAWNSKSNRILSISEIGSLYASMFDINEDQAFNFMEGVCVGSNLDSNDPRKVLRDKLTFYKVGGSSGHIRISGGTKIKSVIKAWNYYRKGVKISVLRIRESDDNIKFE